MTANEPLRPGDRLGFIGLGNMGVPMVSRLLGGGFLVTGYDIDPAQGTALDAHDGYTRAATLVP
jgi:3-hydroxyisobutyrate dehydrogenase-like beta-hydroxyacid dehydrogenase